MASHSHTRVSLCQTLDLYFAVLSLTQLTGFSTAWTGMFKDPLCFFPAA